MQEVGRENIIFIGLTADVIQTMRERHSYNPWDYYRSDPRIRRIMDSFKSDLFCPGEPDLFAWIFQSIMVGGDEYFHLADLPSYLEAQMSAGEEFRHPTVWSRKAILNVARIGKFSSDRTIREYARAIWDIHDIDELGASTRRRARACSQ
jgi:starch phosphorylase